MNARAVLECDGLPIKAQGKTIKGNGNTINGQGCTITGNNNIVEGQGCTIYGDYNIVSGMGCTVYGKGNRVTGMGCWVYGEDNVVSGMGSHSRPWPPASRLSTVENALINHIRNPVPAPAPAPAPAPVLLPPAARGPVLVGSDRQTDDEAAACLICMDRVKCCATLPCGHLCCCIACANALGARSSTCPVCRGRVTSYIRIFS